MKYHNKTLKDNSVKYAKLDNKTPNINPKTKMEKDNI